MIDKKKYLWCFYLGFSLSFVGVDFTDWQYYAIMIPTIMLFVWGYENDDDGHVK